MQVSGCSGQSISLVQQAAESFTDLRDLLKHYICSPESSAFENLAASNEKAPNQLQLLSSLQIPAFLAAYRSEAQCGSHLSPPFVSAESQEVIKRVLNDVSVYFSARLDHSQSLHLGFSNLRIRASARSCLGYC